MARPPITPPAVPPPPEQAPPPLHPPKAPTRTAHRGLRQGPGADSRLPTPWVGRGTWPRAGALGPGCRGALAPWPGGAHALRLRGPRAWPSLGELPSLCPAHSRPHLSPERVQLGGRSPWHPAPPQPPPVVPSPPPPRRTDHRPAPCPLSESPAGWPFLCLPTSHACLTPVGGEWTSPVRVTQTRATVPERRKEQSGFAVPEGEVGARVRESPRCAHGAWGGGARPCASA